MILERYVSREYLKTVANILFVLLLLFLSNKFVSLINRAAEGAFPPKALGNAMLFMVPEGLVLIMPLAALLSCVFLFGKWSIHQEWVAFQMSGFYPPRMIKSLFKVLFSLTLVGWLLTMWLLPYTNSLKEEAVFKAEQQVLLEFKPEIFYAHPDLPFVIYAEAVDGNIHEQVYLFERPHTQKEGDKGWQIISAKKGQVLLEQASKIQVELRDGTLLEGYPGTAKFLKLDFSQYERQIDDKPVSAPPLRRTTPTRQLFHSESLGDKAELFWRIHVPFAILVLGLVAFPLSLTLPREGYFGRLLPAIAVFMLYMNTLSFTRKWIETQKIPFYFSNIMILAIFLTLFTYLYRREFGRKK